jgi:FtsH-binding integral membrane protein
MTKFVEVPIGERKNPSKKEYKTFEVFALNRDEAITHLKDGYTDPLYMPPQLTGLLFAWIFFSSALLISAVVPVYSYYVFVGMILFTISNICLGPLLGWIMLMMDENDGIRALKLTLIITFIAGFIGYSDIYSFAQDKNFIMIMFILLCGLVGFNLINIFRSFSRDTTRYVAVGGAILFSFFIILDFNRLIYLEDLNVNDWNTAFYMSYSIYLDIINLLLEILEAMGE